MANKKKYDEPVKTCITFESKEKILADFFKIKYTDAFRHGLHAAIRVELLKRNDVPEEILSLFQDLQTEFVDEVRERISAEAVTSIQEISSKVRGDIEARKVKILVYNQDTERREEISEVDFDPAIHVRIVAKPDDEEDEEPIDEEDEENVS